jgi:protein-tyrosine phosphatase
MGFREVVHFRHHYSREHLDLVHATEDMDAGQLASLLPLMSSDEIAALSTQLSESGTADRRWLHRLTESDKEGTLDALDDIPPTDHARRLWDILDNLQGATGGGSERVIADLPEVQRLFDILRQKRLVAYTYRVSDRLIRGSRPSAQKVCDLYLHNGVRSTINLCAEMHQGDLPVIHEGNVIGKLKTVHLPITDQMVPGFSQVLELFMFLSDPNNIPAYMHCEQGVGRTGVMTGCYRIAVNGWAVEDATDEAKRFDCGIPMQIEFLREFATALDDTAKGRGRPWGQVFLDAGFPLKKPEDPQKPEDKLTRQDCADDLTHPSG